MMLRSLIILTLIFSSCPALLAETREMIYLKGEDAFSPVQLLIGEASASKGNSYIRNNVFGRNLRTDEEQNLVSQEYFHLILGSSALSASASSVLFFDHAAEYSYSQDKEIAGSRNFWTRTIKIGLIGITALSYYNARRSAAHLQSDIHLFGQVRSGQRAFHQARGMYYATGVFTLLYYVYITIQAYREFDTDATGRDLKIPDRTQTDAREILQDGARQTDRPHSWNRQSRLPFELGWSGSW